MFLGIYRPPATRRRSTRLAGPPLLASNNNNSLMGQPMSLRKASAPPLNQTIIQMPQNFLVTKPKMCDSSTQTISTGEITALNIYFENN